ncbi:hypothetical protein Ahia01_000613700, partial [Argonauta hians]
TISVFYNSISLSLQHTHTISVSNTHSQLSPTLTLSLSLSNTPSLSVCNWEHPPRGQVSPSLRTLTTTRDLPLFQSFSSVRRNSQPHQLYGGGHILRVTTLEPVINVEFPAEHVAPVHRLLPENCASMGTVWLVLRQPTVLPVLPGHNSDKVKEYHVLQHFKNFSMFYVGSVCPV